MLMKVTSLGTWPIRTSVSFVERTINTREMNADSIARRVLRTVYTVQVSHVVFRKLYDMDFRLVVVGRVLHVLASLRGGGP